jgi:hypothetical protein
LLDLLLRRGNNGVRETLTQVHRNERDNLHGLAGAGRLFDEHVFGYAANVEDQFFLIVAQDLFCDIHERQSEWFFLL